MASCGVWGHSAKYSIACIWEHSAGSRAVNPRTRVSRVIQGRFGGPWIEGAASVSPQSWTNQAWHTRLHGLSLFSGTQKIPFIRWQRRGEGRRREERRDKRTQVKVWGPRSIWAGLSCCLEKPDTMKEMKSDNQMSRLSAPHHSLWEGRQSFCAALL